MQVIAAGCFDSDGKWKQDGNTGHPVGSHPLNISRVQKIEDGFYSIHFSVDTERAGLNKFLWYVQPQAQGQTVEIKWVKPRLAYMRVRDFLTHQQINLDNGFFILIVRTVPNGSLLDPNFIALQDFAADRSLLPSVSVPGFEGAKPRGIIKAELDPDQQSFPSLINVTTSVDFSQASNAWFAFYEPPPGSPDLSRTLSKGQTAPVNRTPGVYWYKDSGSGFITEQLPVGKWSLIAYRFSDDMPSQFGNFTTAVYPSLDPIPTLSLSGINQTYVLVAALFPNAQFGPAWGDMTYAVNWKSSNPAVVSVENPPPNSPLLVAHSVGTATITVTYRNGMTHSQVVTVTA